ncbi:MAG: ribonuclease Z [Gaiellales bacterium]|nr:ribonuclease Z [Gaiellales bacterium]
MDLELLFLGTAGAVPTVARNTSGLLLVRGGTRVLVDCGEGTQRQLMRSAGVRVDHIFLTHLHGDHYLGLPGLLKTMSLQGREGSLDIWGPPGLEELFNGSYRVFGRQLFALNLHEARPGVVTQIDGCRVIAARTEHGPPSLAYAFEEESRPGLFHPERAVALGVPPGPLFRQLQLGETVRGENGRLVEPEEVMDGRRPGRKIVISGDTRPTFNVIELARAATVLVHDATFSEEERERAVETRHSTAAEAAGVAALAGAGLLVLTHISSRHSRGELLAEASGVFASSVLPSDFDRLVVPYPDKGSPRFL